MLRRNSILIYSLLIISGILGAWLVGLFEGKSKPEDISGLDMMLSLIGFFILFGAIVGFLVVFSRTRQPMTKEQGISWERIRVKGKRLYIRNVITRVTVPVIASMSLLTLWDYWLGEPFVKGVEIYGLLTIIIIGGAYFATLRMWDYYEWEHSLLDSETQPNKLLDTSAKQRLS
jgi:prolipoprotein diacylglyceryltransferase